jgi:hypothetical protein
MVEVGEVGYVGSGCDRSLGGSTSFDVTDPHVGVVGLLVATHREGETVRTVRDCDERDHRRFAPRDEPAVVGSEVGFVFADSASHRDDRVAQLDGSLTTDPRASEVAMRRLLGRGR